MSDKPIFDPEKLEILEFKVLKGQVDTPEDFDIDKVMGYQLENSLQLGFNLEENLIKSDFVVEVKTESAKANRNEASANFHLVFIFSIENLKDLAKPGKNDMIDLDKNLGNALSSITYSTSRGVLLTRLQGTAMQNFILPTINPNKLLHNK